MTHDFDFLIVGSGFGGSVCAHRLTEKGYAVGVIERGRRFATDELPKTTWDLKNYLWAPFLKLTGIFAITVFKDMVVFHGAGVGGGSLVYANAHLEPLEGFYTDEKWAHLADWKAELAPHYVEAKRMLGTAEAPQIFESDRALSEILEEIGEPGSFKRHPVGVFFGEKEVEVEDPFFDGEGPSRVGCNFCGGCMVGCRVGAKNTLDKNYLYLAEKHGAKVIAETRVDDVRPLDGDRGQTGYEVLTSCPSAWFRKRRRRFTAQKVIFAGGALGTLPLLFKCKERGSLSKLSDQLGNFVRTNSESIQSVNVDRDISSGLAITSGGLTKDGTHIEIFRYGDRADSLASLTTVHAGGGRLPRQLYFLGALLRHPIQALRRLIWPFGWSRGLAGVLAMQALDNSMRLLFRRRWWWPFKKTLTSDWGDRKAPPTYMPDAQEVTKQLAVKLGGVPGSVTPEVLFDTATTAHVLGGCAMGDSVETGLIDKHHRVFNYDGMYVVDGSVVSANLGVNPSLTITALAERAMASIPDKEPQ